MISWLNPIDAYLEKFTGRAPRLSLNTRDTLAEAWPWIALISGVIQLLAAYWLLGLTRITNTLTNYIDTLSRVYRTGPIGISGTQKSVIYIGVIVLTFDGIMLLMAVPGLLKRSRSGWERVFFASLVNLAFAILSLFIANNGLTRFGIGIITSTLAICLLYQVKDQYRDRNFQRARVSKLNRTGADSK